LKHYHENSNLTFVYFSEAGIVLQHRFAASVCSTAVAAKLLHAANVIL
jgi:hypothetical protein